MEFLQLKALFKEIPAPGSTAFPGGTQRTSAVMHRPSTGLCTAGYLHANTGWSKCDTLVVWPCRATWQNW
jgi:hypothetical protein